MSFRALIEILFLMSILWCVVKIIYNFFQSRTKHFNYKYIVVCLALVNIPKPRGYTCCWSFWLAITGWVRLIRTRLIRSWHLIQIFWELSLPNCYYFQWRKILLIRIPLNSKQNFADEWLRINRTQPVHTSISTLKTLTSVRWICSHPCPSIVKVSINLRPLHFFAM